MVSSHRIEWETLRSIIELADAPRAIRLDGSPPAHLFFEPSTGRLGLRVPAGRGDPPASPLVQLRVENRSLDGRDLVEVSTTTPSLYPYFHGFAISVADRVQADGLDPPDAISECLLRWRDLLRQAALLSPEAQLGLLGELWLLERLIGPLGASRALQAWTGPKREAHDFRIAGNEVEVKSTTSERRVHVISSDTQLVPSPEHRLFLLSMQFTSAGANEGFSLSDRVHDLGELLGGGAPRRTFEEVLAGTYGVTNEDLGHYVARVRLRSLPYLIPVDEEFPRISLSDLEPAVDIARITDVRYRVNVEALGWEDGTDQFLAVLPKG